MKIIVNRCYGGFDISIEAQREYLKRKGKQMFLYEKDRDEGLLRKVLDVKTDSLFLTILDKDYGETLVDDYKVYQNNFVYLNSDLRADPDLIAIVEEMGKKASGRFGNLQVIEIPDGVEWEIDEYDGIESVHEKHRSW